MHLPALPQQKFTRFSNANNQNRCFAMQVKLTNAHLQSCKEKKQCTDLDMRFSWQRLSAGFNRGFLDGGGTGTQRTQVRPLSPPVPLEENDEALQAIGMSRTFFSWTPIFLFEADI